MKCDLEECIGTTNDFMFCTVLENEGRCRYYHSEMDGYQIRQGAKYKHLKRSIVIFICTYDPFGEDLSVYTFEKTCLEKPEIKLEDEVQTIILNTAGCRDGLSEALTNLLDYFKTGNITDTYTEELQRQVDVLKHDEDWRDRYMTLEMKMDEKYEAGIEIGKELGIELGVLQILVPQVCHMLSQEQEIDIIAKTLYVSVERLQPIYEVAKKYAPDYDAQKVLNELVLEQAGR